MDTYAHSAWGPSGWGESGWEHGGWGHAGWRHAGWTPIMHRLGPKNYRRTDSRIREDICDALTARPDVDVADVTVEVKDGRVTLDGTVPYRAMKHAIEDAAAACAGVVEVENRISVVPRDLQAHPA